MHTMIHNAVCAALTSAPKRRLNNVLWVSDLGKNPYSAVKRLLTGELEPFDYTALMRMDGGNALEAATLRQVAENLERPIRTQVPLFDDIWSGYADLVIGHGTDDVIIYDHKATAGKWWDYKESLPRVTDCCQVWLYGELYNQMYGVKPRLGLYYRGWGTWGEFKIETDGDDDIQQKLVASGCITGEKGGEAIPVIRPRSANPRLLRVELQGYYERISNGSMTIEEMEALNPNGSDWDYAVNASSQLAAREVPF